MERRRPQTTLTIKINSSDEIRRIIQALKDIRKECLQKGGSRTITIHDSKDEEIRVFLDIDLTKEALFHI